MLTIQNIILINDIVNLPKESLQEICTDIGLPDDGTIPELSERIWMAVREDRQLQNIAFESIKGKALLGKSSVTWYQLSDGVTLRGAKQLIIKNSPFDPFQEIRIPEPEKLNSTPTLIGGAMGNSEHEYFLRFIYKTGASRDFYGTRLILRPRSSIKTVYINENSGYIEVRAEPRTAKKIASSFAHLIGQQNTLEQMQVMAPFGYDAAKIADVLGGELVDIVSKPELLLEDFTQEQADALVRTLSAFDSFFIEEDPDRLIESIIEARQVFNSETLTVPFTALILSGLEKIGMGVSGRDLRGLPLYDFLQPYLQHQGCFIRFEYPDDGVMQSYTIRVGLKTNTIYFMTPATESVVNFVRKHVIIG